MAVNRTIPWAGAERRLEQRSWHGPERRRGDVGSAAAPAATSMLPRAGAVIAAAVVAGVVFAAMEMVLVAVVQGKPFWAPLHMIAAIGLGREGVLPPPAALDTGVAAVAVGVHLVLSLLYAAVLGAVLVNLRRSSAWWIGLLFGIALYYVNFYGFTAQFPWFAEARGWIGFVSHAVFGLLLGTVYRGIDKRER